MDVDYVNSDEDETKTCKTTSSTYILQHDNVVVAAF